MNDNRLFGASQMIYCDYEMYYDSDAFENVRGNGFARQHVPFMTWNGLPMFAGDFELSGVKSGRLVFTALGCADIWINGVRAGSDELKPGWSDYRKRAYYYDYDVLPLLREGKNRILAVVSNGWYSGRISGGYYGSRPPAVRLNLIVEDDGGRREISSGTSWKAQVGGRVRNADIWDGEYCDARFPGYDELSCASFDLSEWGSPKECDYFSGEITPFIGETVKVRDGLTLLPASVTVYSRVEDNGSDFGRIIPETDKTSLPVTAGEERKIIIDFGQETVGWVKIRVKGKPGSKVNVRYSEMLNDSGSRARGNDGPEGSVYTVNYRTARAKAHYVIGSDGEEEYRPTFSFFGFRYVELTCDSEFELISCEAQTVGSATKENGRIETSDGLINKLISNIIWGQRGNYLFVPTDCPQRDERLGWTGDTQAFCRTASYNANVYGFFRKWMTDARDTQADDGGMPDVVPRISDSKGWEDGAAWADFCIIVPHTMYLMYGDKTILSENFDAMERYIAHLIDINGFRGPRPTYGDWLSYDYCKNEFLSSAFLVHDLDLMIECSNVLGFEDKAEYYRGLRAKAYKFFTGKFMKNGKLKERKQTTCVIALAFNLLEDPDYAAEVARELPELIRENGNRLSTGFVGTYNLLPTLSKIGEDKTAYDLLMQRAEPSWLYSIDQGATTVWERWNSYTIEKGFGDVGMNSFNHYAYGAVEEWMYRYMAGIEPGKPGFAELILQPRPDMRTDDELPEGQHRMSWIRAEYTCPAGLIESSWSTEDGFVYECTVPEVPTVLRLPLIADKLTMNGDERPVTELEREGDCAVITLAPGKYTFIQK